MNQHMPEIVLPEQLDRRTDSEMDVTDVWHEETGGEEKCIAHFRHAFEWGDDWRGNDVLIAVPELIGIVVMDDRPNAYDRQETVRLIGLDAVERVEDAHRGKINEQ